MSTKLAVLLFGTLLITSATVAVEPQLRTITTFGVGVATVTPDQAKIQMQLQAENKNSATAKSLVDKQFNQLLAALEDVGLSKENLIAGRVRLNPQYSYKNQKQQFIGYRAVRNTTITIENLDSLSQVIDTSLTAGVMQIGNISFEVSNKKRVQDKTRQLAIDNSKALAQSLATAYGAKLGRIMQISYSENTDPNLYPRPEPRFGESMTMMRSEGVSAGVYLPDTVTFKDRVGVVFELL